MNELWAGYIAAFARSYFRYQKLHKRALLLKVCIRSIAPAFQKHCKICRLWLSVSFRKVPSAKCPQRASDKFVNEKTS